jgi:hypothetical protein
VFEYFRTNNGVGALSLLTWTSYSKRISRTYLKVWALKTRSNLIDTSAARNGALDKDNAGLLVYTAHASGSKDTDISLRDGGL